jgi:hypothetical protein
MASVRSVVARASRPVRRWPGRHRRLDERLRELEEAVQENRRLNRRVAELTDLVTELVVPLARRDEAEVEALLQRYRAIT